MCLIVCFSFSGTSLLPFLRSFMLRYCRIYVYFNLFAFITCSTLTGFVSKILEILIFLKHLKSVSFCVLCALSGAL